MVTCIELTGEGKILASMFFKYTEVFSIVGIVYLILVSITTWILNTVEKQLSIPGFEVPGYNNSIDITLDFLSFLLLLLKVFGSQHRCMHLVSN